MFAHAAQQFHPVHLGHFDIEHGQIGWVLQQGLERGFAVRIKPGDEPFGLQRNRDSRQDIAIIIDQRDLHRTVAAWRFRCVVRHCLSFPARRALLYQRLAARMFRDNERVANDCSCVRDTCADFPALRLTQQGYEIYGPQQGLNGLADSIASPFAYVCEEWRARLFRMHNFAVWLRRMTVDPACSSAVRSKH